MDFVNNSIIIDARPLNHGYAGITRLLLDYLENVPDYIEVYLLFQNVEYDNVKINLNRFHIIVEANPILRRLPSSVWYAFFSARLINQLPSCWFWAVNTLVPYSIKKSINVLSTLHDFVHLDKPLSMTIFNFISFKIFFNKSLRRADIIQTTTIFALDRLRNIDPFLAEKSKVNAPGVNREIFFNNHDLNNHDYLYTFIIVGTIEPRKNIDYAIDLINLLRTKKNFENANLLIIGKIGWNVSKKLISKIDNHKWIKRKSNISQQNLISYYRTSKYLLMTSHDEGFGIPIIEAMAVGCDVICTRLPTLIEASQNQALYLELNINNDIDLILQSQGRKNTLQTSVRDVKDFVAEIIKITKSHD